MAGKRNAIPPGMNLQSIQELIAETLNFLGEFNFPLKEVLAEELVEYFSGEAPSGDVTTLADVINNQWLLLHEIIELSELKQMGLTVSFELLYTHPKEVYEAHITATEWEFRAARHAGDEDWIKKRIPNIRSWLEDPDMPSDLKSRCQKLLIDYS